jgi:hypothetical protein
MGERKQLFLAAGNRETFAGYRCWRSAIGKRGMVGEEGVSLEEVVKSRIVAGYRVSVGWIKGIACQRPAWSRGKLSEEGLLVWDRGRHPCLATVREKERAKPMSTRVEAPVAMRVGPRIMAPSSSKQAASGMAQCTRPVGGRCRVEYFWNVRCSRELVAGLDERRLGGMEKHDGKQVLGRREKNDIESQVWRGLKGF